MWLLRGLWREGGRFFILKLTWRGCWRGLKMGCKESVQEVGYDEKVVKRVGGDCYEFVEDWAVVVKARNVVLRGKWREEYDSVVEEYTGRVSRYVRRVGYRFEEGEFSELRRGVGELWKRFVGSFGVEGVGEFDMERFRLKEEFCVEGREEREMIDQGNYVVKFGLRFRLRGCRMSVGRVEFVPMFGEEKN